MIHWPLRTSGCRIGGCLIEGLDAVFLETSLVRVGVLAGKGADLFELTYKPMDLDLLWRRAGGIRNPRHELQSAPSPTGGFMDGYGGGWQVMLPTLGAPVNYYGAAMGEHGEAALLAYDATVETDQEDIVSVRFETRCRRSPFRFRRWITLTDASASSVRISEEICNEGGEALELMWGHHPVFGPPFLEPGCTVSLPGGTIQPMAEVGGQFVPTGTAATWPRYLPHGEDEQDLSVIGPPAKNQVNELYVGDLPEGRYEITNPRLGLTVSVSFDVRHFPYLWWWRTLGASSGFPWYASTYTLGLEPISSVPPHFNSARQAGTTLGIGAGQTLATELKVDLMVSDA